MQVSSLYDGLLVIWRGRWLVALTTATAVVAALGLGWSQPAIYQSAVEFYVAGALKQNRVYSGEGLVAPALENPLLPSGSLEQESALQGVLLSEAIRQRVHERVPAKSRAALVADARIGVSRTHLFRVRVRDRDPELAAQVANAYPQALEDFLLDVNTPREQRGMQAAKSALDTASQDLAQARAELTAFLEGARTADVKGSVSENLARRSALAFELEQARVRLAVVENRIVAAEDRLQRESRVRIAPAGARAAQSTAARKRMDEIAALQEQLGASELSAREQHELREQLASSKASLASEIEALVTQTQRRFLRRPDSLEEQLRRQIVEAYVDRAALEAETTGMAQALERMDRSGGRLPAQRVREEFLRAEVERYQQMVVAAAVSHEEARTQLSGRSDYVVVLNPARPGDSPVFPLPVLDGAVAGLLGLVAGAYLAFAFESLASFRRVRRALG